MTLKFVFGFVLIRIVICQSIHYIPKPSQPRNSARVPYSTLQSYASALSHTFGLSFNQNEIKCLDRKFVLFQGQCVRLLDQGPCPESCRLVVDKQKTLSGNGKLELVCRPRRCDPHYEYIEEHHKCYHVVDIARSFCYGKYYSVTNKFGDVQCDCDIYNARVWNYGDKTCYPMFSRGVCSAGSFLVPLQDITKPWFAACQNTSCYDSNSENSKMVVEVYFENGQSRCYVLNSQGPCLGNQELSYVEVLPGTFVIKCEQIVLSGAGVFEGAAVSDMCLVNIRNQCVKPLFPPKDPIDLDGYFSDF